MRYFMCTGLALLLAGPVYSATVYESGVLSFETTERQSAWGPGTAARVEDTVPALIPISGGETIGLITGSKDGSVPNLAYPVEIAEWGLCNLNPLNDCGPAPSLTKPADTRTGATVTLATAGAVGVEFGYVADAGSVASELDFSATALIPDPGEVGVGEVFNLNPDSVFEDGKLDSTSPTAGANVDVVVDLEVTASAKGCVFLAGCKTAGPTKLIDADEQKELIGIDPNEIRYLDGFFPGAELRTPLANQSATLIVDSTLTPSVSTNFGTIGKPPIGVTVDLATAEIQVPIAEGEAGKTGDVILLETQSDFFSIRADVDALVPILPVGGLGFSLGDFVTLSLDAYDIEVGPTMDLFQDFTLTPELGVDFAFDKEIWVEGTGKTSVWSGLWDALPDMSVFERTTFIPEFWVKALLETKTGLTFGFKLTIDAFKAAASVAIGPITLLEGMLGPLFSKEIPFAEDFATATLFDDSFDLGGFESVSGRAFVVDPNPPAPVPLPPAVLSLIVALGVLRVTRRRNRLA